MEQILSQFGNNELILIAILLAVLLVAVGVVFALRRGSKREQVEKLEAPQAPERDLFKTPEAEKLKEPVSAAAEPTPVKPVEAQPAPAEPAPQVEVAPKIERKPLSEALAGTRQTFMGRIKSLFGAKPTLSSDELEELEEILYTSDLGPQTVQRLLEAVESKVKSNGSDGYEAVREALRQEMLEIFAALPSNGSGQVHAEKENDLEGLEKLRIWEHKPAVIMVVGVNGAGKTTTIGKLARRLAQVGHRVLVAAGDTFRAAAGDQLKVWTERAQVEIFSPEGVKDPSAVAFKACETAKSGNFDVVIIDTAGRLHTQKNLMEELKKMKRVIGKQLSDAPHEVLLVLDANSGQNALIQAREFHQALEVTGVVLTKLDGSAKGGVAVGLAHELKLPIKLIGVGEGIDDLRRFSSEEFVNSIL